MYRFLIASSALCLLIGLLIGSLLTAWALPGAPSMQIVTTTGATVPVVTIVGIHNGSLVGSVAGGVRLIAGDSPIMPDASGSFAIKNTAVLTNVITVHIPEGMHFVASKKGKKYYPISSAGGQNIVPDNRIYFRTAEEAKNAGYKP